MSNLWLGRQTAGELGRNPSSGELGHEWIEHGGIETWHGSRPGLPSATISGGVVECRLRLAVGPLLRTGTGGRALRTATLMTAGDAEGDSGRPGISGVASEPGWQLRCRRLPSRCGGREPGRTRLPGQRQCAGTRCVRTADQPVRGLSVGQRRRQRIHQCDGPRQPRADVRTRIRHPVPGGSVRDASGTRAAQEARQGRQAHRQHAERRRRLAIPAGASRRGHQRDDL